MTYKSREPIEFFKWELRKRLECQLQISFYWFPISFYIYT